ncbi:MAG: HDIG domain-containing metalloprotein [Chloroflexota bacterium]
MSPPKSKIQNPKFPPLLERLRPMLVSQKTPVYLVGGAVRDALLGRESHDLDFVVAERAIALAYKVADGLGAAAYALDKERDTGRVVLPDGTVLDFARYRGVDLAADLRERDFTINAMALPVTATALDDLVDPCGGLADLQAGLVHPTHPQAITDDPVRALRAIRLALNLGFQMTVETMAALPAAAPLLNQLSPERVRDEWLKLLQTAAPHRAVRLMAEGGLVAAVWPEVVALVGVAQSPPHHEPVFDHTVSVLRWLVELEATVEQSGGLSQSGRLSQSGGLRYSELAAYWARPVTGGLDGRTLLRLAALFHDVGKARTQSIGPDGRIRFLEHDQVGAGLVGERLRFYRFSTEAISHVKQIVAGHMRPLFLTAQESVSRRAIYRFFRDFGPAGLDISFLALADHLATYQTAEAAGDAQWARLLALVAQLYDQYFQQYEQTIRPRPLVNGDELMTALQLRPGPEVGRLLRLIEEAQAAGEITTWKEAIQLARGQRDKREA